MRFNMKLISGAKDVLFTATIFPREPRAELSATGFQLLMSSSGLAVKTFFRERLHLGLQFFQPGRELRVKLLNVFKVT
jgi:hypothetical protein